MLDNILITWFSHSGNTHEIARQIHEITGGETFEIITVNPYPEDYNSVVEIAKQELNSGKCPDLEIKPEDIDSYDTIFVGFPIWWGTMPMAVARFLSDCDLSGKTIIPFCTHGGGGASTSFADLKKLCPNSTILKGLSLKGSNAKTAKPLVSAWLREIGATRSGN
ncbi:MAG TPA: flavodoxin [Synergistaceae bacterium]|nr:hypothetical protein [Synergistales bacterium]HAA47602.1 flavodoxin [Synergistaceae bacterium]HAG22744.1 flavodoxin [Synergistaceae bacterium]